MLRRFSSMCRSRKTIVSRPTPDQSCQMPQGAIPWPHAPTHQLSEVGTYFVTAGTYLKAHHFRTPERLDVPHRGALSVARQFSWNLEAWAVFSNHYHFVARSPSNSDEATTLSQMLGALHTQTASWVNRLDKTPGRKVWHNFWETRLTYQKSYLVRLNYVNQNPVRHRLVPVANKYPWCSAQSFEGAASPAMVSAIYRFRTDTIRVSDDFCSGSRVVAPGQSGGAPPHSKTQARGCRGWVLAP